MNTPAAHGRLPRTTPADLSDEQRSLYAEIAGGPRAAGPALFALVDGSGALNGPFNAMLLSPPIGTALQGLGTAVRYRSTLPGRVREMAILLVATHWDSTFERHAHEAVGLAEGVALDELAALRRGAVPESSTSDESIALRAVNALLERGDLDDGEYADVRRVLGERQLFELSTLVGYYTMLAMQLRLFRVEAPSP